VRGANGQLEIGSEKDGRTAEDWVVEMQRFEQWNLLADMLGRGAITRSLMRALAEMIAGFHDKAETTPGFGGAAGVRAIIDENAALLGELCPDGFRAHVDLFNRRSMAALENLAILVDRRRDAGRVRRCHGDLHLNNICMIGGRPVLFDAIEFNDSFACIDVLYDLAFPLMDLMHHGQTAHANTLLNRYLERTGDYGGLAALPLFLACRAGISAHVALSRAREMAGADAIEPSHAQFRAFVELGVACLEQTPPRLVAIGGISGTGKSTLAYGLAPGLAPAPGAIVLRSDLVRKAMMNVPETQRLPESAYTNEMHERVYSMLNDKAASMLSAGYSVIADAVFGDAMQRDEIARTARKSGVPFTGIWLKAAPAILEHRVAARRGDASDATIEILRRQLTHITSPDDWNILDAAGPANELLAKARKALWPVPDDYNGRA
jgi:hypothetical protein